jgi:Fe-S cluster assembly iron-binding protein IscA
MQAPMITFTEKAINQIKLMLANDYTLEGKTFRLIIGGKECDGFRYQTGFADRHPDDHLFSINNDEQNPSFLIDPFTLFYFESGGEVDFQFDPEGQSDGFVVTNFQEHKHKGKFFRNKPELVPGQ